MLCVQEVFSVCNPFGDANLTHCASDLEQTGSLTPGLLSKSSGHFSKLTTSSQSPSFFSPFHSFQSRARDSPSQQFASKLNSPAASHFAAIRCRALSMK